MSRKRIGRSLQVLAVLVVAASLLFGGWIVVLSQQRKVAADATVHHYMYVFPDGKVVAYDMDNNFQVVPSQSFSLPTTNTRGAIASVVNHVMYVSWGGTGGSKGNGSMLAYDMLTNTILWRQNYAHGIDAMAVTNDGKSIFMPDGADSTDGKWYIENALTGQDTGSVINTQSIAGDYGPHNTLIDINANGQYIYLDDQHGGPHYVYKYTTTAPYTLVGRIGPFQNDLRPMTINNTESLLFQTVTGLLGFQVADINTGKVLYTTTIQKPAGRSCSHSGGAPSHGVSLSPDNTQLYVVDYTCDSVDVFDVTGLPASAPRQVADIPLTAYAAEGWVLHSRDGKYVFVGDDGDVVNTATRGVVAKSLADLRNSRRVVEVDWQNGQPSLTTGRHGLGYTPSSPGDINSDGTVNVFDFSILLSHFNTAYTPADLNGDGTVNVLDQNILIGHFGT